MSDKKTTPPDDQKDQPEQPTKAPNPFDPESMKLGQEFGGGLGVKKLVTRVSVRKPGKTEWVQVRPGADWRLETAVIEDKENREVYYIDPSLRGELLGEYIPVCLFYTINRRNDVFLWMVKLPGEDGRRNSWNDSAMDAAEQAMSTWVRIVANMPSGIYDVYTAAVDNLPGPKWPEELSMADALKLAFKNNYIDSMEHPYIEQLFGKV